MKKDAYYFPHFSNARNDSKVIKLRRVLGIEGYGIYFMLLEVLREQTDFKLPLSGIEDLAYEWHTSKEKIISVINDYGMFEIDDNMFFSPKLLLYLQPYIEKSERARLAARSRWDAINANAYANALPAHSKSNASKVKESKVKESKEEKTKQAEFVFLLELEYEKLVSDYGTVNTEKLIKELDNYKGASGKTYKSDYRAILSWVVKKVLGDNYHSSSKILNPNLKKFTLKAKMGETKSFECENIDEAKKLYHDWCGALIENIKEV